MLVGYNAPGKLRRESVVPFRMVDGRVYHQNLESEFPDLTIRTSGSVGIDQTISLMAEMPVPPKWIGNNQLGTALRDQIIRIPITGTLNKPQLDRNVMNQFNRQFMEKAAGNLIKDELQKHVNPETLKGLEGLFRPR